MLALVGPPLARFGLAIGPAEYFSLMVFGLMAAVVLARGALLKALGMIMLGLLLGCIGPDITTGASRSTFGSSDLSHGIDFTDRTLGILGLAELIRHLEGP